MPLAKIGGKTAYHKTMWDLAAYGYIRYEPSCDRRRPGRVLGGGVKGVMAGGRERSGIGGTIQIDFAGPARWEKFLAIESHGRGRALIHFNWNVCYCAAGCYRHIPCNQES